MRDRKAVPEGSKRRGRVRRELTARCSTACAAGKSLLGQYGLPADVSEVDHPQVPGYDFVFRNTDDVRDKQVLDWMNKSLVGTRSGLQHDPICSPGRTDVAARDPAGTVTRSEFGDSPYDPSVIVSRGSDSANDRAVDCPVHRRSLASSQTNGAGPGVADALCPGRPFQPCRACRSEVAACRVPPTCGLSISSMARNKAPGDTFSAQLHTRRRPLEASREMRCKPVRVQRAVVEPFSRRGRCRWSTVCAGLGPERWRETSTE